MKLLRRDPGLTLPTERSNNTAQLKRGSVWAVGSLGFVSVAGFAFWIAAAATSPDLGDVGRAAAWFTLMQLMMTCVALGVPILINRTGQTPTASEIAGMSIVGMVCLAGVFGFLSPLLASDSWATLSGLSGLALGPFVALAVAGSALTLAVDARLISLRRWRSVFVRGALPSILRLALLFLDPFDDRATWIAVVAIGPLAFSGIITLAVLAVRGEIKLGLPSGLAAGESRFLWTQHLSAVVAQAPYHVIPLLVALRVAGPTNAAFYLIWSIGVMTAMLPQTLTQVLLSETSLELAGRLLRIRVALAANLVMAVSVWLASVVLARPVLALVGPTYEDISRVLPWIVLASVAWGVTSICLTEARLAHDAKTTALIAWSLAVVSIGIGLIVIPMRPVWAATFVWLGANIVAAVVGIASLEWRQRVGLAGSS